MAFIEVDETNFSETIQEEFSKGQIIILKFGSEYCDTCMALGFELEELDDSHDNVTILEIDAAESEALTQKYGVTHVPTMVIYKDKDTTLWNKEGVVLAQDIEKIIGF